MTKTLLIVSLFIFASTLQADESTKAKRIANMKAVRDARIAANGGLVTKPFTGKYIAIVNNQSKVKESDFFSENLSINGLLHYVVKVVRQGDDVSGAALTITLSDDPKAPSIIVAPEVPWAGINVGALAVDNPEYAVLSKRLRKEIWRAFMYACGAANSTRSPCLMRPIYSLRDLDSNPVEVPCPDSMPRVMACAKALGLGVQERCNYRRACEEGWAPAPTNDIQRAVWEKVHSIPDKPIKITFDKDKQKPVVK